MTVKQKTIPPIKEFRDIFYGKQKPKELDTVTCPTCNKKLPKENFVKHMENHEVEPKELEWRKRFYKQFCYTEDGAKELDWNLFPPIQHNGTDRLGELTDFIDETLTQQRTELLEEILGLIGDGVWSDGTIDYNKQELIKKIKKL